VSDKIAIKVEHVSKKYCKSLKRSMLYGVYDIGRNVIGLNSGSNRLRKNEFWAVDDISFEVRKGETIGIIGPNGSGKTTLLKMLNGIFWPDKGKISIRGRVGALIEVGAGFHPLLTGRENIYINAAILGMTKKEVDKKFDAIVNFAEIGDFIDSPVKFYSSGMFVRLGFAVAVNCEPDILLVDEVLSVGDYSFQTKCIKKIEKLRKTKTTVILVTHNLDLVYNISNRAIYLNNGSSVFQGKPLKALEIYISNEYTRKESKYNSKRIRQDDEIKIIRIRVLDKDSKQTDFVYHSQKIVIDLEISSKSTIDNPVFGIALHRNDGTYVAGFNSRVSDCNVDKWKGHGNVKLIIDELPLTEGIYSISASITMMDSIHNYDYWQHAVSFRVKEISKYKVFREHGVVRIPCNWVYKYHLK
jgi:lipopolysaccharide transport system ATP-binding protein